MRHVTGFPTLHHMCNALQQNSEQVTQACFEMWTIVVGMGLKDSSSVDFEIVISDCLSNMFL